MQESLGADYSVVSHAIGSQNSVDIATRMGVGELTITFPSNVIPASGSVRVRVQARPGMSRIFASNVHVAGVAGFLRRDQSIVGKWTFSRANSGEPVALNGPEPAVIDDSADAGESGYIWAGRNNAGQPEQIEADVRAMWDRHRQISNAPMWVIGVTPARGEGKGTRWYADRTALNDRLRQTYGDQYIPLDRYLVNNALAEMGKAPTGQDWRDVQAGLIPSSLMMPDGLHLNDMGRRAAAHFIASFMKAEDKTYMTSVDPQGDIAVDASTPGVATVIGWGFDKGEISRSLTVSLTVDGVRRQQLVAALPSDYLYRYGVWGQHAFVSRLSVPSGQHEVCAIFHNLLDGENITKCQTVESKTIQELSPQGDVVVEAVAGTDVIRVMGWAFDHSQIPASIRVQASIDGVTAMQSVAAYPSPYLYPYGVPGNHAFVMAAQADNGTHTVCVTAINEGPGRDTSLGCHDVTVSAPRYDPEGSVSFGLVGSGTTVRISGYAFDASNLYSSVQIAVFHGSQLRASTMAALGYPSLTAYGIPGGHGYSVDVPIGINDWGDLCVLALNVGAGQHTWLGCTRSAGGMSTPQLALSVQDDAQGGLQVDGWAIDHSLEAESMPVYVSVDGQFRQTLTANRERKELSWLFGWAGDHGFMQSIAADLSIPHEVCVRVPNRGYPAPDASACSWYTPDTD